MAGTVFLSSGQDDRELKIAQRIAALLEGPPFGLTVFIARSTNNLRSLNNDVLTKLAYADYVIFVNFLREGAKFSGSIYAHQELAMALALGHEQLLLFSEQGAPDEGIIRFVVQNRPVFTNENELLELIRADVEREGWRPDHSRFLRATRLEQRQGVRFGDGVGNVLVGDAIGVVIENQSRDLQDGAIVTLEKVDGNEPEYLFRSPVKVSGQRRYDAAIPPGAMIIFDLLMDGTCTGGGQTARGVFLVWSEPQK